MTERKLLPSDPDPNAVELRPGVWLHHGLYLRGSAGPVVADQCGKVAPWGAVCPLAPGHPLEHDWRFYRPETEVAP